MKRGSNMPAVGTYNQALVLDMIRRSAAGVSRTELVERTGLSAQTLSNVARRLVAEGLVVEGERVIVGPGKPRTLLHLNRHARFAVGIHIDPSVDTLVILDLSGEIVAHTEHPPTESSSETRLIEELAGSATALLHSAGVDRQNVLGIGAAVPGPLNLSTGTLLTPPLLPHWRDVPLRDSLSAATGLPVTVEKDVIAAMVGELWVDADGSLADAALIYFGAGVGLGMSTGGEAVRGRTGNSGDIGHLVVNTDGPRCFCGNRGCLGVSLSPEHILREAGSPAEALTAREARAALRTVEERAASGDATARSALASAATSLATAIVLVNNVLEVGSIVLGGPSWSILSGALGPLVRAAIPEVPQTATVAPIRLVDARRGSDLAAAGAASLVLDEVFTARPAHLMIRRD